MQGVCTTLPHRVLIDRSHGGRERLAGRDRPWTARLGSLRAWPHGYHARSPQESPPGDRGRHRRRRHASRSVHRTEAALGGAREAGLRLAGQAVPPAAPCPRVLRRPAHRDDAEGHAQQLPLRDRHLVPERHGRLRDARRRRAARVVPARDRLGRRSRRPHRVRVLAHQAGRPERPACDRVRHGRRLGRATVGARALLRAARRCLRQPAARGRSRPVRRHDDAVGQAAPRGGRRPPRVAWHAAPSIWSSRPTTRRPSAFPDAGAASPSRRRCSAGA